MLNNHPRERLPNTINVSLAGPVTLSPVLKAMGIAPEVSMGAIRCSLGRGTTESEVEAVADRLGKLLFDRA
jgi:cysteine desulfurase